MWLVIVCKIWNHKNKIVFKNEQVDDEQEMGWKHSSEA